MLLHVEEKSALFAICCMLIFGMMAEVFVVSHLVFEQDCCSDVVLLVSGKTRFWGRCFFSETSFLLGRDFKEFRNVRDSKDPSSEKAPFLMIFAATDSSYPGQLFMCRTTNCMDLRFLGHAQAKVNRNLSVRSDICS